jgi:hypothetical protein
MNSSNDAASPLSVVSFDTALSRRTALKSTAFAAVGACLSPQLLRAAEAETPKPTLHVYPDYGWLRGFSVVPSWGARIEEAWWSYDGARMREEVALARTVHANCIRLWIEYTAWMADPDKVTASFMDAVAAIGESGMKVMPCLFNRWHNRDGWDYGGTYTEDLDRPKSWREHQAYLRTIVTPLARDPRVLIWDLCNEPQGSPPREDEWLKMMAATVRECGIQQPLTIGDHIAGVIERHAPWVDVLCFHPYAKTRTQLAQSIRAFTAMRGRLGKPMLVNECIPGSLDDAKRAAITRDYDELLSAAGFGWMGWALREGKAVSTRRDRYDNNGIDGEGFHPFFTKEGRLRPGLEFLTEKPKLRAPWEKD